MKRLLRRLCRVFRPDPGPELDPADTSDRVEVPPGWLDPNPNVRTACRLYYRRRFAESDAARSEIARRMKFHTSLLFGDEAKRFNRYLRQIDEETIARKGKGNAYGITKESSKAVRDDVDRILEDGHRLLDDGLDLLDDGLTMLDDSLWNRRRRKTPPK